MRPTIRRLATAALASICLFACAKGVVATASAAPAASTAAGHRIVIEVNVEGPDKWEGILNNVDNLQKAFGADATHIEVVAHGKGLGILLATDEALKSRMSDEAGKGVVFAACENTMRKQNVKKEDLLPFATTVDSGVAEVVRKQEAGWSYLKGGS
jgi:intracellular sulfur oxidation DsrE/DsrF family protein